MATATALSLMSSQTAAQNTDEASDRGDPRDDAPESSGMAPGKVFGSKAPAPLIPSVAIYRPRSNSKAEYSAAVERAMEPPQDLTVSVVGPLPNFPQQQGPTPAPNPITPQEQKRKKSFRFLRKKTLSTPNPTFRRSSANNGGHDFMNTSAPSVLIRSSNCGALDALSPSLRSSMSCRTLEESLHRGRSPSQGSSGSSRSITFANVNIREYERTLGDNPSVRNGPPLSIGWRHSPDPVVMPIEVYEEYKGAPRDSKEFCVPRLVREELLAEHAGISRREMANAVRTVGKIKSNRRKTVVNLGMSKTEERIEKAKTKILEIIKPSTSYEREEARLWDDAHAIAVDKAQRLEESIHRGESVGAKDLYRVGMPVVPILPSRRNTVSVEAYGSADAGGRFEESKVEETATHTPSEVQHHAPHNQIEMEQDLYVRDCSATPIRRHSNVSLASSIVVAEANDDDDIFANLVQDANEKNG